MHWFTHEPLEPEFPEGNSWQNVLRLKCQGSTQCDQSQSGREEIMIQRKLSCRGERPRQHKELSWTTWPQGRSITEPARKEGVPNGNTQGQRDARPWASQSQNNYSFSKHLVSSHQPEKRILMWQSPASLACKFTVIFWKVDFYAKWLILIFWTQNILCFLTKPLIRNSSFTDKAGLLMCYYLCLVPCDPYNGRIMKYYLA